MKLGMFEVVCIIGIVLVSGVVVYGIADQVTVVWKDTGHVANYQPYPVAYPNGDGDHLLQRMVIMTINHGNVTFDTANMCGRDLLIGYSCSQGSVDWANGAWVFVYHLSNGGNFVGQLNP